MLQSLPIDLLCYILSPLPLTVILKCRVSRQLEHQIGSLLTTLFPLTTSERTIGKVTLRCYLLPGAVRHGNRTVKDGDITLISESYFLGLLDGQQTIKSSDNTALFSVTWRRGKIVSSIIFRSLYTRRSVPYLNSQVEGEYITSSRNGISPYYRKVNYRVDLKWGLLVHRHDHTLTLQNYSEDLLNGLETLTTPLGTSTTTYVQGRKCGPYRLVNHEGATEGTYMAIADTCSKLSRAKEVQDGVSTFVDKQGNTYIRHYREGVLVKGIVRQGSELVMTDGHNTVNKNGTSVKRYHNHRLHGWQETSHERNFCLFNEVLITEKSSCYGWSVTFHGHSSSTNQVEDYALTSHGDIGLTVSSVNCSTTSAYSSLHIQTAHVGTLHVKDIIFQ